MKHERRFVVVFVFFLFISVLSCAGPQSETKPAAAPAPAQPSLPAPGPAPGPAQGQQPPLQGGPQPAVKVEPLPPKGPAGPAPSEPPQASAPGVPAKPPVALPSAPPASQVSPPSQPTTPAKPGAPLPAASQPRARPQGQGVVFKFDNADLYEVIRTFAEVLKISYVIDPRVKGTVNIHTSGAISNEDIQPIFLSILRMNGATIVKKESIYEIVPFSEGKRLPVIPDEKKRSPDDQFVIEIIKPNFIPIAELDKVIKPFLSDEKEVILFPQNNMIIIADLASNVRKLRDIMSLLDIDIFSSMSIRIYPVYNSDVNDMAKDLGAIFSSFGISSKEARGGGITFTPIVRSNSLLVVSSMPGILEKVENWIKELDKPPSDESKVWVHVYYVQNAKAKDLAEVLKQVYVKTKETIRPTQPTPAPTPATPTPTPPRTPTTKPTPTPTPPTPARDQAGGTVEGDINIVVDEQNNALVVRALYRDYKAILETIQKLDIYPKQVLIDLFLADVTLNESVQFGIEWSQFIGTFGDYTSTFVGIASPPAAIPAYSGGFRYSVVDSAGKVSAAINAAAQDNRLKVLSSPHILASNNKEAKIQIGTEQPILTNTYTSTATTASDVITGTIEYKDTGIILTVTPRISDGGLITMEVQLENSKVSETTLGSENNLLTVPVFDKVTAKTTLSVMEGQMVIIGGLIGDVKTVKKSGIPFLYKIPVIGALFGYQTYETRKTELVLLMTPHVIADQKGSRAATEEYERRLKQIRKEMEEREKQMK
jgi:general secretion pathway protein D